MSESSICGGLCVACCYSGLFQWCSQGPSALPSPLRSDRPALTYPAPPAPHSSPLAARPGSGKAQKQSGCFSRGCGGMDDEDAFDRADREDCERKARLRAEAAAGGGGAAAPTVAQPGKVEPMLAVVNPEYLAEVEAGQTPVGGPKP